MRRATSWRMRASRASTSSTPPTCTRRASPRPWSANCSRPRAMSGCWPPRSATRCRSGPTSRTTRAAGCCASCDASLQRLGTDHVDIYYLHRDYLRLDLEEPLRALQALLQAGKIRCWGLSNFRGWRIAEAVRVARAINLPDPVVCQPYYNLLNRQPEVEVLEACAFYGIGVVPYSPIARGVLSGKYAPAQQARRRHPRRARRPAHHGNRVPRRVAGDRADPEGPLREARALRWPTSPPPGCWPTVT